jgi:methionyl-tRNA synthetase
MAEKVDVRFQTIDASMSVEITKALDEYKFDVAMGNIWERIKKSDQYVSENKVWTLVGEERKDAIEHLIGEIRQIATDLAPFMPETAQKIAKQYAGGKIEKSAPLFPRLA